MRKLFLLIFLIVAAGLLSEGQTPLMENLKRTALTEKDPRKKLQYLLQICEQSEMLPKDTIWKYAEKAKVLAEKLQDKQGYTRALIGMSDAYTQWENIDSAKILVESELAKYTVDDPATRSTYFKVAHADIDLMDAESDFKGGMSSTYKLLSEAQRYKDTLATAENMNTLGVFYYDLDKVPTSTSWYYMGLKTVNSQPKYDKIKESIYLNLSDNYWWINKLDSAIYCIERSLEISRVRQDLFFLSVADQKLAAVYTKKKEYQKALNYIQESLVIGKKIYGAEPQRDKLIVLSSVYKGMKQYDKGIKVLLDGMKQDSAYRYYSPHSGKKPSNIDLSRVFYEEELADGYKQAGYTKQYIKTLEKLVDDKDAFYEANNAQAIAALETKFNFQKQETTIAQQKLAIAKKNYLLYAGIIVLLLVGVIVWMVFANIKRRQKLRLEQVHEEEKQLSAKAVAEAEETERKRIAADLHDNLGAQLSFIKRNVNFILDHPSGFGKDDERRYLGYVNDIAQNAMIDLRETLWVLNKDEVTLQEFADKLKSYLQQQLSGKDVLQWNFTENIGTNWKLSAGDVMHLFRITQEVINNIIKHSGADTIDVRLESRKPGEFLLAITDNGKGFDTQTDFTNNYGIQNMKQRAKELNANFSIESNSTGTGIVINK